jgi:hypothetical protein
MYYSDEEFTKLFTDEKVGNVRFFKKCLREYGLIGARQKLSDEHIPIFNEIRAVREAEKSTWEQAIQKVLKQYIDEEMTTFHDDLIPNSNIEKLLTKILHTLERIEEKMDTNKPINHYKRFTEEENRIIEEVANKIKTREEMYEIAPTIAEQLGRSVSSICKKIEDHKGWYWVGKVPEEAE